ncbi:MAG: sigma-70 family RNA polymerase sigma factor [Bacteroidia bacterium]|nr:sigma-70 family RNA polymerase sigma factor [Bacteroidia bacterium]
MHISELETYDDLKLVLKYKETNNNNYVGVLYKRYTHLIFGTCMKYLKNEEDAQDASIQLFEKLLIDLKKHEIQQFKSWLHMVCKNFCLMKLRSDKSKQKNFIEMQKDFAFVMESEYDLHLSIENKKETELTFMEECLQGLNEEQRLCVELFYLQEKSYVQVADETRYSMNNVKSYIQNGKRNLKNCIESKNANK